MSFYAHIAAEADWSGLPKATELIRGRGNIQMQEGQSVILIWI